jgi:hypothetical protein
LISGAALEEKALRQVRKAFFLLRGGVARSLVPSGRSSPATLMR